MAVQKLKAIIIDDEGPNIDTLDKILSVYCPGVIVVARCKDPVEAIDLVKELKPHMVFLDITMPEMNGFDFLKSFNEITFKVVFTTAYSEYALKAIKYAAFDYLLKPINYEEVIDTVNRIKAETQKPMAARISTPSNAVNNLAVPTTEGFHFVDIHEIIYCKSDNSYTNLILKDGKKIVVSRSIKETGDLLERHNFFRIHQSFLVNARHVKKFDRHNNSVYVLNGDELPVSTRKKDEFLQFVSKL